MSQDPHGYDFPILNYASTLRQGLVIEPVRVGPYLVVGAEARLPARCPLCNAPASGTPVLLRLDLPTNLAWDQTTFLTLRNPTVVIHACYCLRQGLQRAAAQTLVCASLIPAVAAIPCRDLPQGHKKALKATTSPP